MNQVIEALLTRRSIRSFTDQVIPPEELQTIATAAIYAPSGMNRQTWQFVVVDDRQTIDRLAALVGKAYGAEEGYCFYRPAAVIIAANHRESRHGCADCSCALQNMFLAAHSLGIGSVWINQLNSTCDTPEVRAFLRQLGLKDTHIVYGMAALGYAATPASPPDKRQEAITYYQPETR